MNNPIVKIIRFLLFFPLCFIVFSLIDWGLLSLFFWVIGLNLFWIIVIGIVFGSLIWLIFKAIAGSLVSIVTYLSPVKWVGALVMLILALGNGVYLIYEIWSWSASLGNPGASIFVSIVFTLLATGLTLSLIRTASRVAAENNEYSVEANDSLTSEKFRVTSNILDEYYKVMKNDYGGIARPVSLLKHTKSEIKQAFLDYKSISEQNNLLTDEIIENLSEAYRFIDYFVDDEKVDIINRVHRQRENKQDIDQLEFKLYFKFRTTIDHQRGLTFETDR